MPQVITSLGWGHTHKHTHTHTNTHTHTHTYTHTHTLWARSNSRNQVYTGLCVPSLKNKLLNRSNEDGDQNLSTLENYPNS